ncbi:hypothetical protein MAF45_08840 [Mesosutterella sp. OilRF-GAM-744-9]|uniref:DUF2946 domain-containing protein n=1 Tax=Mesosutterella porci TaxID=2915351 RepID=A0ABS9MSN4_9BURK|nr:hypothetical protein [Mesosutterella sp. oilRF-744-WT-GAM-9]MCG5031547.1 hypothetical protein [Mesosutterella sp. oilRF-744-WT-GAM-9]
MDHANAFLRTALGALLLFVLAAALLLRPSAAVSMMGQAPAAAAVPAVAGPHACCPGLGQHRASAAAAPQGGGFHHVCCELTLAAGSPSAPAGLMTPPAPFPAARTAAPELQGGGIYRPPIA